MCYASVYTRGGNKTLFCCAKYMANTHRSKHFNWNFTCFTAYVQKYKYHLWKDRCTYYPPNIPLHFVNAITVYCYVKYLLLLLFTPDTQVTKTLLAINKCTLILKYPAFISFFYFYIKTNFHVHSMYAYIYKLWSLSVEA